MRNIIATLMMSSTLLITGCATQTGLIQKNTSITTPQYSESQSFFVGGIGQEKTVDAAKICGGADKVSKVQSKLEPKDLFFGIITLAIYTPHTAKVYCQQ